MALQVLIIETQIIPEDNVFPDIFVGKVDVNNVFYANEFPYSNISNHATKKNDE